MKLINTPNICHNRNGKVAAIISDPDPTKSITIDFSKMQENLEFPGGTNDIPVRVIRRSLIDGKTEFSCKALK